GWTLEAVPAPPAGPACLREVAHGLHCRSEAGNRAAAQVIAVREPAGEDDRVQIRELCLGMPDEHGLGVECGERPERVAVVAGAGEAQHADTGLWARHVGRPASSIP